MGNVIGEYKMIGLSENGWYVIERASTDELRAVQIFVHYTPDWRKNLKMNFDKGQPMENSKK